MCSEWRGRFASARSGQSSSDSDSSHSGGAVCFTPTRHMIESNQPAMPTAAAFSVLLLALGVVPASKQELAKHVIRHSDFTRQNCRPKTKLAIS